MVGSLSTRFSSSLPPRVTPLTWMKPVPVIVTLVPPPGDPLEGLTAVILMPSAVAVKVTGEPASPAAVAVRVLLPAASPRVQLPTVATPEPFVVWFASVREPPPEAIANVPATPPTGEAFASVTMMDSGPAPVNRGRGLIVAACRDSGGLRGVVPLLHYCLHYRRSPGARASKTLVQHLPVLMAEWSGSAGPMHPLPGSVAAARRP